MLARWEKVGNFFGTYYRSLDEKNRLQLPSKLVGEMPQRLYVLKGFEGCLSVYEEPEFKALLKRLSELSYLDPSKRRFIRLATSSAVPLDVDSHGRIGISKDLVDAYHIGRDVAVIGVLDHFEVWDKAAYERYHAESEPLYEKLAKEAEPPSGE